MGQIIQLEEAAAALGGRRTGFVYCPAPDAATERAFRRACHQVVYTPEVVLLSAIGVVGAAWIIGSAFWSMWLRGGR